MGSKRNVDMSDNTDKVKIVEEVEAGETSVEVKKAAPKRVRSGKYTTARAQVDKTKTYDPFAALELVKRLSYSKFAGSVEVHGVLREAGLSATLTFPHSTGKTVRARIFDEALLEEIEAGQIDFDVLIATPADMPKLSKHARTLGPKGLMPNPKSGTLTPNPEAKLAELSAGAVTIKTEKKAPLFHTVIGKTDMDTKELLANLTALIKAFKGKMVKLSLSSTMSPGVKVDFEAALEG